MSVGDKNNAEALASVGPCWILSFDKKYLRRSFVAKDWTTAVNFLNKVSDIVEKNNNVEHGQSDVVYPEFHFTNGSTVQVVLPVARVALSQAIDLVPFECSPAWLSAQPTIMDMSSSDLDQAVSFDVNHYKNGLNGDFIAPGAIAKFGGTSNSSGEEGTTTTVGIFEDPELRDIARAKESIVESLRLVPGDVVADIGAGTGLLEPLLSEAVGSSGQVIISEISSVFREYLQQRCSDLSNITILDDPTDRDPKLPPGEIVDVALMVDVYHHLEYPYSVLRRVRDSLKSRSGALVVIDFHRDPLRIASHDEDWVYQHLRADKATYIQEIERTGFVLVEEVDVPGLPENYCLVFRKRPLLMSQPGEGWTC